MQSYSTPSLYHKAVQSMSRRGNCYDNAVIESFFAILKSECFYSRTYHSIAELQAEIEEYLVYYNQKRIKFGLKGLSPVQYRAQYLSELTCPTFGGRSGILIHHHFTYNIIRHYF